MRLSTQPVYDKEDHLKQITHWVLPGERLYAVFDCNGAGIGFMTVTHHRANRSYGP